MTRYTLSLLLLAGTLSGCQMVEMGPHKPRYFGYWGGSPLDQTAAYTNVSDLSVWDTNRAGDPCQAGTRMGKMVLKQLDSIATKAQTNKDYVDIKATIHVQDLFLDNYRLRSYPGCDYRDLWRQFAEAIRPRIEIILGFWLPDEPFGNAEGAGVSYSKMSDVLEAMTVAIKSVDGFEKIPTLLNFAAAEIRHLGKDIRMPGGVDWIGTDIYRDFQDFGDDQFLITLERLIELRKGMKVGQKLFMIPDAIHWLKDPKGVSAVLERIEQWQKYISWDLDVVAVFPFYWKTYPNAASPEWFGAESVPAIRDKWAEYGREVKARSLQP